MAEYQIIPKATLDSIEESIQRKRGETAPISPSQMPLAIDTIPSSVDGTDVPVGGIYFTKPDSNGNPTECNIIGYAPNVDYEWQNFLSFNYFPHIQKIEFVNTYNIKSIGGSAFRNCSSLATITLPDGLISIDGSAFIECSSLTTITLPDGLISIGGNALQSCSSLTTITLPNSLTSIGAYAFNGCSSLTTITLPNSLTFIGAYAFNGCSSLKDVVIENGFNCNNLNLSVSARYTAETIVSWLEALVDRTGQTTFTLTIGTTNLNKLTAEQKAIATNKNWTLA